MDLPKPSCLATLGAGDKFVLSYDVEKSRLVRIHTYMHQFAGKISVATTWARSQSVLRKVLPPDTKVYKLKSCLMRELPEDAAFGVIEPETDEWTLKLLRKKTVLIDYGDSKTIVSNTEDLHQRNPFIIDNSKGVYWLVPANGT